MSIFKKLFKKKEQSKTEFRTMPVVEIIRETEKAVSLVFDKPEEGFDFTPGQYLTLQTKIEGNDVRRAYSLCNLPNETVLKVTVKETQDGYFSKYVNNEVSVGDLFEVMPPQGKFLFNDIEKAERHIIGFAVGSGITPIFSILKSVLYNEPNSRFTLFYGNRADADIIFREELSKLQENYSNRLTIVHVLSGKEGRIDKHKVNSFATQYFNIEETNLFYLCGPNEMVSAVSEELMVLGVDKNNIKSELFTAPITQVSSTEKNKKSNVVTGGSIKIIYAGNEIELHYSDSSKTILDMALDNDIKVPFSCLNGVCSSCSCKVEKGNVQMAQNYTLEKEEIADGYALSCQAKPTTQTVIVNFDDNRI